MFSFSPVSLERVPVTMSHFLGNDVQFLIDLSEVGNHLRLDEGEEKLY